MPPPEILLPRPRLPPPAHVCGLCERKHLFHFSYQRYLINQIRENFGLEHTPIRLVVRERGSGEVGAKDV